MSEKGQGTAESLHWSSSNVQRWTGNDYFTQEVQFNVRLKLVPVYEQCNNNHNTEYTDEENMWITYKFCFFF